MSAIDDLPPLREIIRRHKLTARKSLGQNFLLDLNLTARIARAAGPLEDTTVIEVGPGPGPISSTVTPSRGPAARAIRPVRLRSSRKFWPSDLRADSS